MSILFFKKNIKIAGGTEGLSETKSIELVDFKVCLYLKVQNL